MNFFPLDMPQLKDTLYKRDIKTFKNDKVKLSFKQKNLASYAIWSDKLRPYICLEPTHSGPSMSKPENTFWLELGTKIRMSFYCQNRLLVRIFSPVLWNLRLKYLRLDFFSPADFHLNFSPQILISALVPLIRYLLPKTAVIIFSVSSSL